MTLQGKLITDAGRAVPSTRVAVAGGPGEITGSDGRFQIILPNRFSEGERIIITVARAGWVVNAPLDGEWNLPNLRLQSVQLLDVIIIPRGSKALWTHARIEKYVARLADEVAKLKKESATPKPIDFASYLGEWAKQFGFSADEVKAKFDEWAKSADDSSDYKKLGLRAFYQKNFAEAAINFDKAAGSAEEKAKRSEEQFYRDQQEVFETLKLAGNSYSEQYKFREALERYIRAEAFVSVMKNPADWGDVKLLIANMKTELGLRVEPEESRRLLAESEEEFREVLAVQTREKFPQHWAALQNNLGVALSSQAAIIMGEEAVRLLTEAVEAFNQALTVRTREHLQRDWAGTQNNLGIALARLGDRIDGEEGTRLLTLAIDAYHKVLTVYTYEHFPQIWARIQNNLGVALQSQGERIEGLEGTRLLAKAVEIYRRLLTVSTREQLPQDWARVQINLGSALASQQRVSGEEGGRLLAQSVEAYRQALTVYTRQDLPQQWAQAQSNLGDALLSQGKGKAGVEGIPLFAQAVEAFRQSLTVYTRQHFPQPWARAQSTMGVALQYQGDRMAGEESIRLLAQAVEADRQALTVYTRELLPQDWALTMNNLALALRKQAERVTGVEGPRLLEEAVAAHKHALTIYTREQAPVNWATTQRNLARAYVLMKDWVNAAKCYQNLLTLNPDDKQAYEGVGGIIHDNLFSFEESFDLKRRWLEAHPDDLSTESDLAESYFTTARFVEFEQRIATLLTNPRRSVSAKSALRMIQIANLLALAKEELVPEKLDELTELISIQPADFKVNWSFNGTLHFIGQHEKLAPHREWLRRLFAATQPENREALIKALREARAAFRK